MAGPRDRLARIAAALLVLSGPRPADAESLLEMFRADPLADLGAPETRPRTRRGQVIYPAPGLPAIARGGQEIVARVRVRRAMTPPPGVQQRHFLFQWRASLAGPVVIAARGTSGNVHVPLEVVQIRPEDEGFVYRIRLRIPSFTPRGVYDLLVEGPGLADVRYRAVRILSAEGEEARSLEVAVVRSGEALWQEAEPLWIQDPDLVIVPGGMLEASDPLSRWPLATLSVAAPRDSLDRRCFDLPPEVFEAVRRAAACPSGGHPAAQCVVDALGGPAALDSCGDDLLTYLRDVGPPVYAVGLGGVTFVGLWTFDVPPDARATVALGLGDRTIDAPPRADPARPWLGSAQRAFLDRHVALAEEVVVLAHRPPAPADSEALTEAIRQGRAVVVAGATDDVVEGGPIAGPASVRLRRNAAPERWTIRQTWGLEPGTFALDGTRPRPVASSPSVVLRSDPDGIDVKIRYLSSTEVSVRALVPATASGWRLEAEAGPARIVGAAPGGGDLCDLTQVLLEVRGTTDSSGAARLRLRPGPDEEEVRVRVIPPRRPPVVGRVVELRAEVEGPGWLSATSPVTVLWTLGDGAEASGSVIQHRYARSGPSRVCVAAMDDRGRAVMASLSLEVVPRGGTGINADPWARRAIGGGLAGFTIVLMLLGLTKGNIFHRRRRWSSDTEDR